MAMVVPMVMAPVACTNAKAMVGMHQVNGGSIAMTIMIKIIVITIAILIILIIKF